MLPLLIPFYSAHRSLGRHVTKMWSWGKGKWDILTHCLILSPHNLWLLSPFFKGKKCETRSSVWVCPCLSKVTQLVTGRADLWTQVCPVPKPQQRKQLFHLFLSLCLLFSSLFHLSPTPIPTLQGVRDFPKDYIRQHTALHTVGAQ